MKTGLLKKAYNDDKIRFINYDTKSEFNTEILEVWCIVGSVPFCFIDPAKSVKELLSTNTKKQLIDKIIKNVKLLKKYQPSTYYKIEAWFELFGY